MELLDKRHLWLLQRRDETETGKTAETKLLQSSAETAGQWVLETQKRPGRADSQLEAEGTVTGLTV